MNKFFANGHVHTHAHPRQAEIVTGCPDYKCYTRKLSDIIAEAMEQDADTELYAAFNLEDPAGELDNIMVSLTSSKEEGDSKKKEEEESEEGHDVATAAVFKGSLPGTVYICLYDIKWWVGIQPNFVLDNAARVTRTGLFYFIQKLFGMARDYLIGKLNLQDVSVPILTSQQQTRVRCV